MNDAQAATDIKALLFDVFGTVVDWRTSLIEDLGNWGKSRGIKADWVALVDAWRGGSKESIARLIRVAREEKESGQSNSDGSGQVLEQLGIKVFRTPALGVGTYADPMEVGFASMPPPLASATYSGIQSSPRMRLAISKTM